MYQSSSISAVKAAHLKANGWKQTTMSLFGVSMPAYISPYTGKVMLPQAAVKSQNRKDNRASSAAARKTKKE